MEQLNPNLTGKLLHGDDLVLYSNKEYELKLLNHDIGYIFSDIGLELYNVFGNISTIELDEVDDMVSLSELVKGFLSIFTNAYKIEFIKQLNDYQVYFDESNFTMVNQQMLSHIFYLFRKMYCIPDKEDSKSATEEMSDQQKKMLEQIKSFQKKVENKHITTFDSIVETISVKHNSYNLLNIWSLKVYQLMQTYQRLNVIDNYNNIMLGIYTGNVDSEKIDLNTINYWSK